MKNYSKVEGTTPEAQSTQDPRYSMWRDNEKRAKLKESDPTYSRSEAVKYIDAISDYVADYNEQQNRWSIAVAFLFGSILDPEVQNVHDIDLCIALLPKNETLTYIGDSYNEETEAIQKALKEICPFVELHRWEEVAEQCNDGQLMDAVRLVVACKEGIQPYVLSGNIQLVGGTNFRVFGGKAQLLSVRHSKESASATIEFLAIFSMYSIVSVYRGWLSIEAIDVDCIEKTCRIERALGFEMDKLFPASMFVKAAKTAIETSYATLIKDLERCVLTGEDWNDALMDGQSSKN